MEIIRGLINIKPEHRRVVASIGNFDGVHRGHQALLAQVCRESQARQLPATIITFEPHPQEFFSPKKPLARISLFRDKLFYLHKFGAERVVILPFNRPLAEMSAQDFIESVLVAGLNVEYLVIGDDFRFGKGRQGDVHLLAQSGATLGFKVEQLPTFVMNGQRVSSTLIREALAQGKIELARDYLGHSFSITGKVVHGDKRGRVLGFPTANIPLTRRYPPIQGIFVVSVEGVAETPIPGVASCGYRPMYGGKEAILEVHLFDLNFSLYGRRLRVNILHKLRDEMVYDSEITLIKQMHQDVIDAKAHFEKYHD